MKVWQGLVAIVALLLVGCGKYEEREREVGFKGLAKINHLLGAERLANEMGLKASSYAGAPTLPPAAGTTLMLPAESLQSVGQLNEMEEWLFEGGNLIVYLTLENRKRFSRNDENATAPYRAFLEHFSLRAELAEDEEGKRESAHITSLGFEDDEEYQTDFKTPFLITDDDYPDQAPKAFYSYEYGDGTLTVLASAQLFTNESIGKGEHATLLWHLLTEASEEQVWFIHSTRISFFQLLWQRAPQAVVLMLVTIVLLVWWASRGFGPKFIRGTNPSARLDAHLHASGAFFVKHRADLLVVSQLQGRLFRKLARALNQPFNAAEGDLLLLAEKEGVLNTPNGER